MTRKCFREQFTDHLSRRMTKPTKWHVRPAKTQISLLIHAVWSENSLCAKWEAKDQSFLHADIEDSNRIGWMPMMIWVFAERTGKVVGFVMRRLILSKCGLTPLMEPVIERMIGSLWHGISYVICVYQISLFSMPRRSSKTSSAFQKHYI